MDGGKEYNRSIAEQKLKAFSIGSMGKVGRSKKDQEEIKKKQDEEEVSKVYKEFVSTFEDAPSSKLNKSWVKAGTFNAGNRKEDKTDSGKLYKPTSKLLENIGDQLDKKLTNPVKSGETDEKIKINRPEKPGSKKKEKEKKKSNLEAFKEELKAIQEEREERHRYKSQVKSQGSSSAQSGSGSRSSATASGSGATGIILPIKDDSTKALLSDRDSLAGSHDTGDPTTTNVYLGNLSPQLTEQELMEMFGKYGPLASIKIMWPRTEEEKARGRNCGFVAYMSRFDAERAFKNLLGKDVQGFEMKMGWGKPVPIPLHPIYIPPALLKLTMPPAPSGLPFNCQPEKKSDRDRWKVGEGPVSRPNPQVDGEKANDDFHKMLKKSFVKVCLPTDRTQLCLINRMAEYVIREGPMFEAMIMNRELNNRVFQFLFENQSPEHIYYRWRLYSLLQGDAKDDWRTEDFRMFKGGSTWKPPAMNMYANGMDESLMEYGDKEEVKQKQSSKEDKRTSDKDRKSGKERDEKSSKDSKDRGLSDSQRDRFEDMLRNLMPDRNPLAETMVWCIEHAEAGDEIVECIAESLSILQTPLAKKIARVYLISDILHNCSIKGVPNVSYFRKAFQAKLPEIFNDLNVCYKNIDGRMKAEAFRQRVVNCFRAWEDWALYPQDFLIRLQNIFFGLIPNKEGSIGAENDRSSDEDSIKTDYIGNKSFSKVKGNASRGNTFKDDDLDGKSYGGTDDEDVDGIPLDGAALLKSAQQKSLKRKDAHSDDSDLDGAPLTSIKSYRNGSNAISDSKTTSKRNLPAGFVPSKWETVDQKTVESQAVTSKWDIFDQEDSTKKDEIGDQENLLKARDLLNRSSAHSLHMEDDDDDIDGVPLASNEAENDRNMYDSFSGGAFDNRMSEDRRARLREIELKVMQYQDELESGKQPSKPGWTISEQVEQFRKKIMKTTKDLSNENDRSALSRTPRSGSTQITTPGHTGTLGDFDSDEGRNDSSRASRRESPSFDRKSRNSKSNKKRRRGRGSSSSSRSRSRSRERRKSGTSSRRTVESSNRGSNSSRRRDRNSDSESSSESDDRGKGSSRRSKRSRSRSPSRKHKKKRR